MRTIQSIPAIPFGVTMLLAAVKSALAQGLPTGGQVVQGSAQINTVAPQLMVVQQSSDRAVIDWQSFNIGSGRRVDFKQPNAGSAVLNRVTGGTPSEILGTLTSNGHVYLLNPSGILFGAHALVDVGSFLGAAASVSDSNAAAWQQGANTLSLNTEPNGVITNNGQIAVADGGFIGLAAAGIRQNGLLFAKLGEVRLASGSAVTVDFTGDGLLSVATGLTQKPQSFGAGDAAITVGANGEIVADGGTIALTAKAGQQVLANLISIDGKLWAQNATVVGDAILLSAEGGALNVNGRLDAAGATQSGGAITLRGSSLALNDDSAIDASGAQAGGIIALTALDSSITSNGQLLARGANGNGGSVLIDAAEAAVIGGDILTRDDGSGASGNLDIDATRVSYSANYDSGGAGSLAITTSSAITIGETAPVNETSISGTALEQALRNGANTTITNNGTGSISVNATIDGRVADSVAGSHGSLMLSSAGDVNIDDQIITDGASITVRAQGNITMSDGATLQIAGVAAPITLSVVGASSSERSMDLRDLISSGPVNIDLAGPGEVSFNSNAQPAMGDLNVNADEADVVFHHALQANGSVDLVGNTVSILGDLYAANGLTVDGETTLAANITTNGAPVAFKEKVWLDPNTAAAERVTLVQYNENYVDTNTQADRTAPVTVTTGNRIISIDTTNGGNAVGANITFDKEIDVVPAYQATQSGGSPTFCADQSNRCTSPGSELAETHGGRNTYRLGAQYPDLVTLSVAAGSGTVGFSGGIADTRASQTGLSAGEARSTADPSKRQSTNTLTLDIENAAAVQVGNGKKLWVNNEIAGNAVPANSVEQIQLFQFNVEHPIPDLGAVNPIDGGAPPAGSDSSALGRIQPGYNAPNANTPNATGSASPVSSSPGSSTVVRPSNPGETPNAAPGSSAENVQRPDSVTESEDEVRDETVIVADTIGGRGVGAEADLGLTPSTDGAAADVFGKRHHVVTADDCNVDAPTSCPAGVDTDYLHKDAYH